MEGYDVIPSAPVLLRFSNLHTNFVILHWDPPARHGETVTHYELVTLQVSPTPGKVITYPDVQPQHTRFMSRQSMTLVLVVPAPG